MPAPLFAWGTVEDVATSAAWTRTSLFVAGSQTDPFGQTGAGAITANANVNAFASRNLTVTAGRHTFAVFLKGNGTTLCAVKIQNATTGVSRMEVRVSFASNVATTTTLFAGAGTFALVQVGSGAAPWYLLLLSTTVVAPADTHRLELFPDPAAGTQGMIFYVRPVFTHGYNLDSVLTEPVARDGSVTVRSPSGVEDAWDMGTDEMLTGTLRWMDPDCMISPPGNGYQGDGTDLVGVGCRSLLRAGRQRQTIRYVRDRTDCTSYVDGYLTAPYQGGALNVEPDGTYSLSIGLKSTTPYRGAR